MRKVGWGKSMKNKVPIVREKAVCLTKYGPEGSECPEEILPRKDFERRSGRGDHANEFWWGIGEKGTAESIWHLITECAAKMVLFAAIKDPKRSNHSPEQVFVWRKYRMLNNNKTYDIPEHVLVTSSINGKGGKVKQMHFALVCKTDDPIEEAKLWKFSNCHYRNLKKQKTGKGYELGSCERGQRTTAPLVKWTNQPIVDAECDATISFMAKLCVPNCVELCD